MPLRSTTHPSSARAASKTVDQFTNARKYTMFDNARERGSMRRDRLYRLYRRKIVAYDIYNRAL
jgi:hypothetical protein